MNRADIFSGPPVVAVIEPRWARPQVVVKRNDPVFSVGDIVVKWIYHVVNVRDHFFPVRDHVVAIRDDVVPVREDVVPAREDVVPIRDDVVPVREDVVPAREDVVPVREDVVPVREDVVPAREDVVKWFYHVVKTKSDMARRRENVVFGRKTVVLTGNGQFGTVGGVEIQRQGVGLSQHRSGHRFLPGSQHPFNMHKKHAAAMGCYPTRNFASLIPERRKKIALAAFKRCACSRIHLSRHRSKIKPRFLPVVARNVPVAVGIVET
jgi:hypothetical protein